MARVIKSHGRVDARACRVRAAYEHQGGVGGVVVSDYRSAIGGDRDGRIHLKSEVTAGRGEGHDRIWPTATCITAFCKFDCAVGPVVVAHDRKSIRTDRYARHLPHRIDAVHTNGGCGTACTLQFATTCER